jgi:hypothetical protein
MRPADESLVDAIESQGKCSRMLTARVRLGDSDLALADNPLQHRNTFRQIGSLYDQRW